MPSETLAPPEPLLPVDTEVPIAATPNAAEMVPYYAMSEEAIRARIDEARANVGATLVEAERRKAAGSASGETKPAPLFLLLEGDEIQHHKEGRVEDPEKARVMAEAEAPYRERAARLWHRAERVHETIVDPTSWLSVARQPLKLAKFVSRGLKADHVLQRGWNAAIIAGVNFERMLEAAMPYVPKIEVSETISTFLDTFDTKEKQDKPKTGTEPSAERPLSQQTESLVRNLHLDAQLAEQLQILQHNGLLKKLSNDEMGIVDDEGNEHPAPTAATIRQLVERQQPLIREKASQGFTRMLLVTQAVPAEQMAESFRRELVMRYRSSELHDAYGEGVRLDSRLLSDADEHELFGPKRLSGTKDKTTHSRHDALVPGWRVVLVKNMPEIPQRSEEVVSFGGRGEFVAMPRAAGRSQRYIEQSPVCHGEKGFTVGAWLAYAHSEMARNGTLIDYHAGTFLLDSGSPGLVFKKGRYTPWVGWGHPYKRSDIHDIRLGESPKRIRVDGMGVRTLVDIS